MNEKQLDTLANCDDSALIAFAMGRLIIDEYGCFKTLDEYFLGEDWDYGPELSRDYDD